MSNAIFPTFVGLKWGLTKSPTWAVKTQRSASQRSITTSFASSPIWRFKLSYEFLRHASAFQELQSLVGFFNSRRGSFDSFLYSDPNENSVIDQVVAVTVAGQTKYKLNKTYGGFTEGIGAVNGTPAIKLNGTIQSAGLYVLDDNGYITWNTAPAAGQTMAWTGAYYYRVRFVKDSMDVDEFLKDLWEAKNVEFESVKL